MTEQHRTPKPWLKTYPGLIIFAAATIILGGVSGVIGDSGLSVWYQELDKSPLNPPGWAFGVVWPILYILMGIAVWLIYRRPPSPQRRVALSLFAIQFIVNLTWSWVFFDRHLLGWSVIHIALLIVLVIATVVAMSRLSRPAAALLVPYLLWIIFALHLSYEIWRRNT